MRLLTLTNLYPPQHLGGFGVALERLTAAMARRGWQCRVLSTDQAYLGPCGGDQAVMRQLRLLGTYQNGIQHHPPGPELDGLRRHNHTTLAAILQEWRPDACLLGNLDLLGLEPLQQLMAAGVPTVQHVGFLSPPFPRPLLPSGPYRMATASAEVARELRRHGFATEADAVVHPPLDLSYLDPCVPSRCPAPALQIGFSGLLMPSKGPQVLLDAAHVLLERRLPFELVFAGKPFTPGFDLELKQAAHRYGLDPCVRWLGFVQPEQLPDLYQQWDVLVFPSLYPEAFGMVVAEAMACACVPISSGVGGAFEVITHGTNGLLVPPGDPQALADVLTACIHDRTKLQRLGRRAQNDSRRLYAPARSAQRLETLFQQLMQRPVAGPALF